MDWPKKIPPAFEKKISQNTIGPIARQVVPHSDEQRFASGFSDDPVGDTDADQGDGVLVKYEGRALMLTTSECAVHCRFCFRKAFSRSRPPVDKAMRDAALCRLGEMTDIREIIFSGGDPLMLSNHEIKEMLSVVETMSHVERVRFHTRMVTAAPDRVDSSLCEILTGTNKQVIVVTHVNHPEELDDNTAVALDSLRKAGVLLLNQSVLLRHVNDRVETLIGLSEKLVAQGVLPYYLHQLDRVTGARHFEVSIENGRAIIKEMRRRCAGYMVPRYVKEIPNSTSKTVLL
jgi:EF-P beta-lysylation protein EpmB